jgi:hypothetical protein
MADGLIAARVTRAPASKGFGEKPPQTIGWSLVTPADLAELLKTTATVTKRNTDLQFLLGGNTVNMDDAMKAWYM